ncbi:MAG: SLC13 family permease [Bacilli bacterium]
MVGTIIVSILTVTYIIASILFFPRVSWKKISFDTYWIGALIGALVILLLNYARIESVWSYLSNDSQMNPFKILSLFLSMTLLSVYLDELGFFKRIAMWAHEKAGMKQSSIFIWLYMVVSILTIFTSNDIIILTFTPFICHFAKRAKINPLPYLVSEFIAANTWSNMLIIGNPTNIYLATSFEINFFEYVKVMFLPTFAAGVTSFGLTYWLFRRDLKVPMSQNNIEIVSINPILLTIGLVHLGGCTIFLSISSVINFPMWLISLLFAISLSISILIYRVFKHERSLILIKTIKRLPWTLIPFVLSMFILVLALKEQGITLIVSRLFDQTFVLFGFGGLVFANLVNNIPMSIMFVEVLRPLSEASLLPALYATIIASNIGAYLTPIGALAGIMWMSILKREGVKFSFIDFVKTNAWIALVTMSVALGVLFLIG